MKSQSEKQFKVTEGGRSDCDIKLYASLDTYGSMKLKGTPSPCLFKLFVGSQCTD